MNPSGEGAREVESLREQGKVSMWALICDTNDGELRVVSEGIAREEYLNADRRANK